MLGSYQEVAPFYFARYGYNANVLTAPLIPVCVGAVFLVMTAVTLCCALERPIRSSLLWALLLPAIPIFFSGIAEAFSFNSNSPKEPPLFISLAIFALALCVQLIVMVLWFCKTPTGDSSTLLWRYGEAAVFLWDGVRRMALIGILAISYTGLIQIGSKFILIVEGLNVFVTLLVFNGWEVPLALVDVGIAVLLTIV